MRVTVGQVAVTVMALVEVVTLLVLVQAVCSAVMLTFRP
jgi:hypothetical protein